jgi:RHS repeat-associated protein
MGCRKISYYQGREGKENCFVFLGEHLEKKPVSSFFCDNYYPFGLTFNSYTSGKENLYKYNGKEEQKETGWLDYGARMYDNALGRFFNQDRFADKYLDFTPYQYAANNPVLYIDVNGDSINFSSIMEQGGVQAVVNILSDLSEQTGISSIGINSNGNLTYGTDDSGNAEVSTDDQGNQMGSATARDLIVNAASDKKNRINVNLRDGAGSATAGNNIGIDPSQIQGFIDGTSGNLNSKTLGFGMTFLHELGHTDFAGNKSDYSSDGGTGPNVNQMNKIRKELDGNSTNRYLGKGTIYGIRSQYEGIAVGDVTGKPGFKNIYIPFKGIGNQINTQGKINKP